MPSKYMTRSDYRSAKCCGTCAHEDSLYCRRLAMRVNATKVCKNHAYKGGTAPKKTRCSACAFGAGGDHSCKEGCGPDTAPDYGCYLGRAK